MSHPTSSHRPAPASVDLTEYGAPRDGVRQTLDSRLFMQLLVFHYDGMQTEGQFVAELSAKLGARNIASVLYADTMVPRGYGLLTWFEDPEGFVTKVRPLFQELPLLDTTLRPDFAMVGRTYSSGFEQDLAHWMLRRPIETVSNPDFPWHVWYPLRRSGEFARLAPEEQGGILREHGTIGMAYGATDLAHDVRLACHGLDAQDNEFLIGLVGKTLFPLSHLVQAMRKTRQTAEFIAQMGPFFVGRVLARTAP